MEWTQNWPNKVGFYWFYGYRYGKGSGNFKCKKELHLVEVSKCSNGLMYIASGQFLFKSEPEDAVFQKTILPELPKEEL